MIRYCCPNCAALIVAHVRRAGQSSVCKACLKPHAIPTDRRLWLDEASEPPLAPEPAASRPAPIPTPAPEPDPQFPLHPEVQLPPVAAPTATRERLAPAVRPAPKPAEEPTSRSAEIATQTPPPSRARTLTIAPSRPAPPASAPTAKTEPARLQTQADITAALVDALTSRLKPRAAPRPDLRPSTAVWMFLTAVGLSFVTAAFLGSADWLPPALLIGTAQVAVGYAWIVVLVHKPGSCRGLLCAIPPLTLYFLTRYEYAKLRPLRFVATGAVLVGLCLAAAPQSRALGLMKPHADARAEAAGIEARARVPVP